MTKVFTILLIDDRGEAGVEGTYSKKKGATQWIKDFINCYEDMDKVKLSDYEVGGGDNFTEYEIFGCKVALYESNLK